MAGLVERVTHHNAESGFCVSRIKARGQCDLVTVVGHAASISAGAWVQMRGTWINDRMHGLQCKAAFLRASAPTTLEGIEKYLGSGMIRGIGPKRARRIVAGWADVKVIREIMLFLHANGVDTSWAVRIFKTYGQDAVQVISENPTAWRATSAV